MQPVQQVRHGGRSQRQVKFKLRPASKARAIAPTRGRRLHRKPSVPRSIERRIQKISRTISASAKHACRPPPHTAAEAAVLWSRRGAIGGHTAIYSDLVQGCSRTRSALIHSLPGAGLSTNASIRNRHIDLALSSVTTVRPLMSFEVVIVNGKLHAAEISIVFKRRHGGDLRDALDGDAHLTFSSQGPSPH